MRRIIVATCLVHGYDIEAVAPRGWWRGLAACEDLPRFNAAWDALEEGVADMLEIPDSTWEQVLARCFGAGWRGEYRRVLKADRVPAEAEASDGGT
jgi:hypothetical protein